MALEGPALNRFLVLEGGERVLDLSAGVSAGFAPPDAAAVEEHFHLNDGRTLVARSAGDTLWVLNLKAIA
ncbi:hypothetical protein ACTWPT_31750 [Nonomuraea sp. 3N208]|uniref:hypothetical protein n=1 Tax=Nonomuraea sp. 3N208 TaxID=3457421 RepID=UPI003FCFFD10